MCLLGIGSIIKALRKEKGITVYDLSLGICSERYMYMIENNSKYPSVEILRKLSDRLELNIFEYFQYIGFCNPIKSKWLVEEFRRLREVNDFDKLIKLNKEALASKDANKNVLKRELLNNQIVFELFLNHNIEIARSLITDEIMEITNKAIPELLKSECDHKDYNLINLLNYYFIYLVMANENDKAFKILSPLRNCLHKYRESSLFRTLYITVSINYF